MNETSAPNDLSGADGRFQNFSVKVADEEIDSFQST